MKNIKYSILILGTFLLVASCVRNKKIAYFKDIQNDSSPMKVIESIYSEPLIQPDDILSITIQTIDPQNSNILIQSSNVSSIGSSSANSTGNQIVSGYLVDKEGILDLPMIGKIKLMGLSTFKARDFIREKASLYYKNPTVQVRFANFKITVLGEVAKPATYTLPNEKVSILDIIGLAGDLTIFGKRDNVLLIRENAGQKEFIRLNLNSTDIFKSPYFYLKQNDILYIEPVKRKNFLTEAPVISIFTSVVSTGIVLLSFLLIKR